MALRSELSFSTLVYANPRDSAMKLLDQLVMSCRIMNFAPATEECYRRWVEDYLRFHRNLAREWVHPQNLRERHVEHYLSHLAVNRQLAASSQSQAMCALVF